MPSDNRVTRIANQWPCPKCKGTLQQGSTYIRSGDKPSLFTKNCDTCDFSMLYFEMKKGYAYTVQHKKEN